MSERTPSRAASFWSLAFRRFVHHRLAVVGIIALGMLATMALAAPLLAPHSPTAIDAATFQGRP